MQVRMAHCCADFFQMRPAGRIHLGVKVSYAPDWRTLQPLRLLTGIPYRPMATVSLLCILRNWARMIGGKLREPNMIFHIRTV